MQTWTAWHISMLIIPKIKTTHLHRQVEKYKLNILKLMAKRILIFI